MTNADTKIATIAKAKATAAIDKRNAIYSKADAYYYETWADVDAAVKVADMAYANVFAYSVYATYSIYNEIKFAELSYDAAKALVKVAKAKVKKAKAAAKVIKYA